MGIINIAEIKPNMVLAADLRDVSGRLLISKGTVLNRKYIKICKMWGVIEADIEGICKEDIDNAIMRSFNTATLQDAEEAVRKRFIHNDLNHPVIRELFRLCTLQVAANKGSRHETTAVEETTAELPANETLKQNIAELDPIKFVNEDTQLSTLPDIFRLVNETISRPNSSAYDIADVISKDTNLSARLLRIVNSAFYGYPSKIDTLTRAVNIVGTKQLSTLAIGINIINLFKHIPSKIINMKSFWMHSILCGINARLIAGYKNIQNTERLFVAGLLHDIGRLMLYNHLPELALNTILYARNRQELLYRVEHNVMKSDHAIIGGMLLEKWKLPMSLENTVKHHHNPEKAQNRLEAAIVHLADIMANATGKGSSGEHLLPQLDSNAWEQIGLSTNILSLTMEQSNRQKGEIFDFFFADDKQTPPTK